MYVNDEGDEYIEKAHLKEWVQEIMGASGEQDSWNENDFEDGYL